LGSNFVQPWLPLGSAFLIEVMGTFLLVFTVMMTAVSSEAIAGVNAPIAIGWSVFLAHLILIPFTGCGINPARSAGPQIVSAAAGVDISVRGWWVYYTAPFVGSFFATMLGMHLGTKEVEVEIMLSTGKDTMEEEVEPKDTMEEEVEPASIQLKRPAAR
jgi:glycerol uptake facilitator-like aquaporin